MKHSLRAAAFLCGLFAVSCLLAAAGAQVITLQVTAELAIVREKPDIMSPVLRQLVTGAVLEAEKKDGEWYEVRVDQDTGGTVIGYVHESLVRVVAGATVEAKTSPKVVKEPPPEKVGEEPAEKVEAPKPPVPVLEPEPRRQEPAPGSRDYQTPRTRAGDRGSVSLWFGGQYAVAGDLNDGAQGMIDNFASQLGVSAADEAGAVHLGTSFGIEYRHPLAPGVYGAVGAGYFSAENSTTLGFEGRPETTLFLTTPRIRAIPIDLSLVFYPVAGIYVKAGAELAFAHCEYFHRFEEGTSFREWRGEADDVGLGYALAGGMEWELSGSLFFFAEAGYRKVRVDGLEGAEIYSESGKPDVMTEGTLYFSRRAAAGGSTVAEVFVRPLIPGGTGVVEARKAELSLSGLSLRVGLKIGF